MPRRIKWKNAVLQAMNTLLFLLYKICSLFQRTKSTNLSHTKGVTLEGKEADVNCAILAARKAKTQKLDGMSG